MLLASRVLTMISARLAMSALYYQELLFQHGVPKLQKPCHRQSSSFDGVVALRQLIVNSPSTYSLMAHFTKASGKAMREQGGLFS